MLRRDVIKTLLSSAVILPLLNESAYGQDRKSMPIADFSLLWIKRGKDEFRANLNDVEHYRQVCWLLRDTRANVNRLASPWLLHSVAMLQALVAKEIGWKPIEVVSGLRMPETNRAVGGCRNSFHLPDARGMFYAMDVRMQGVSSTTVGRIWQNLGQGGTGFYEGKNFVHLDVGNPRSWG
ncbi:D-Ala-D-Ala carboxypeptidase family metallohydrolase [Candidatus Methylospira mobilis]|uniref:YcbK family protein n=1 Tax=Candidatus Methylospira mobilis TaxID=1808979 RepID=UPI0028E8C0CC|nr:DUF882 domain-containing protein [Candidatus Methylospira mobilis]WNV05925.1 D-Ala-D-Ala carboxypeptidase family metallohydrolase [Candidatus Methylospira mobilis]